MDESVATWPATKQAGAIRAGDLSSRDLLECYLDRIDRLGRDVNAVVTLDTERARAAAAAADEVTTLGGTMGPLHGLPITIKDAIEVAGVRSTGGATELTDYIPTVDAPSVGRLKAAGAIVFGKTNVPYMLADAQSYNDIYGTTNNPWDPTRSPGGSSGGEAATLAAGLSALGAGSDIAGSLRNPAHYSGVYGHKPTWGLISTRGHAPPGIMTPTDISVVGPMARHAEDLDLALRALTGPDLLQQAAWRVELPPPRHRRLGEFRVAVWSSSPLCRIDATVSDLLIAPSAPSRGPERWSTIQRVPRSTTRNTTVCSCCCCVRPRRPACATRISPGSRRSPPRSPMTTPATAPRWRAARRCCIAPGAMPTRRGRNCDTPGTNSSSASTCC
jgi:amidase